MNALYSIVEYNNTKLTPHPLSSALRTRPDVQQLKIQQHTLKADVLTAPDKLRLQRHISSASKREGTENEAGLRRGAVSCDPVLEDHGGAGRLSRVQRKRESVRVQRTQWPEARGSLARSRKMHLLDWRDSGATVFTGLPQILPKDFANSSIPQGVCVCVAVWVFACFLCVCACVCV